jgi:hypothetical protein
VKIDADGCEEFEPSDLIWYTPAGTEKRYPGIVANAGDGFELEIVHSCNVATTAHITELSGRASDG